MIVKDVVAGFGADASGRIVPGDVLLTIDGRPLSGMTLEQVKSLMLGNPGTRCVLDVMRNNEPPFKVEVTRIANLGSASPPGTNSTTASYR